MIINGWLRAINKQLSVSQKTSLEAYEKVIISYTIRVGIAK
jgi:hypothetical protein